MLSLNDDQKQSLLVKGYSVVPKVVPDCMVDAALRAINHSIGSGMDPKLIDSFYKKSFCPELCEQPVITDLLNRSPGAEVIATTLGVGKVIPAQSGQLALRFPTYRQQQPTKPHIDGMYPPSQSAPNGTLTNFTAVVGVQLSEIPAPGMGNLAIWPGTHLRAAAYLREHGPASVWHGMPPISLNDPIEITCGRGDLVVMHYLLIHGITGNRSPHVRYTVYFRLKHMEHDSNKVECMLDPWLHWEGMWDLTGTPIMHRSSNAGDGRVDPTAAPQTPRRWNDLYPLADAPPEVVPPRTPPASRSVGGLLRNRLRSIWSRVGV